MRVDSETTKHSKNEVVKLTGGLRKYFEVGRRRGRPPWRRGHRPGSTEGAAEVRYTKPKLQNLGFVGLPV